MHPLLENKNNNGFNTTITLFHGSNGKFKKFDINKAGSNTGYQDADNAFYLTASKPLAENYSVGCVGRNGGLETVLEFKVNVNNPKLFERSTDFYRTLDMHKLAGTSFIEELKEQGHDSIIVRNDMEEVIVFDADNILPAEDVPEISIESEKPSTIESVSNKVIPEDSFSY